MGFPRSTKEAQQLVRLGDRVRAEAGRVGQVSSDHGRAQVHNF